jgi:hypothetical protein
LRIGHPLFGPKRIEGTRNKLRLHHGYFIPFRQGQSNLKTALAF